MERNEVVKEVEERDFETLFELYRDVFNKDLDKKDCKKSFEKIKDRDIYVLGYYINDEIVGTVTVYILDIPTGKEAMVWDFLVEEKRRNYMEKVSYDSWNYSMYNSFSSNKII